MGLARLTTDRLLRAAFSVLLCTGVYLALSSVFAQTGPEITSVRADPSTVDEGDVVALEVEARHPDDAPLRFGWSFGDGSTLEPSPNGGHTFTAYLDEGDYEATVRVEDGSGNTVSDSVRVTVRNVAPRVESIERTGAAIEQTEIGFRVRAIDPGDDELTYAWDFGDGSSAGPSRNLETVHHAYGDPGSFVLTVTVDDGDGGTTTYTETIVVGEGFRFQASGALPTGGGEGESPFLMGLPLVQDGQLYKFAGDLGAAARGEPGADPGARCFVSFGSRAPTIGSGLEEGTVVRFTGIFPNGLREGTYPVTPVQNRIPFEIFDPVEREWAAPGTFFAHASNLQNVDETPTNVDFHGTGGTITVQTWEEGRVEISFSVGLEESQGPLDAISEPGGLRLPPAAQASVTGTFQHEIQRSMTGGSGSLNAISGSAYGDWYLCAPRDPLQVEEVVPAPELATAGGAANDVPLIDFRDPDISVRFSEPVDVGTAVENVVLEWRRADGSYVEVPILVIGEDDRTLRLSPLEDLMDGVVYRARIVGGLQGVEGRDGEVLAEDEEWLFETILNLSEDRNGVTLAVTQVARDAPLVADKPTETRVYLNWREKPHVHPEWQTRDAAFDVSIQGASYPSKRVRVKRFDLYTAEEKKHALDSVNFYGWQPSAAGEHRLTAQATQVGQSDQPETFEGSWTVDGYGSARPLRIDYRFATIGSWSEGVPPVARALGHRIAQAGAVFTEQTFPVPHVVLRPLGDIHIREPNEPIVTISGNQYLLTSLLSATWRHEDAAAAFREQIDGSSADVVIMFLPPDVMNLSGFQYAALGNDPRLVAVQVDTALDDAVGLFASTVAHEVGHAYGLRHNTTCELAQACVEQGRSDAIEGTRIAEGGAEGWNKSKWSGNAQASLTPGSVLSMMHETNLRNDGVFITNADYAELQSAMRSRGSAGDPPRIASGTPAGGLLHVQASATLGLQVSGWVDADSGEASLLWVRPAVRADGASTHADSAATLALEARAEDGTVSARIPIEPPSADEPHAPEGWGALRAFTTFVPVDASTASIALVADGRVVDERKASASVPTVAFDAPSIDARDPTMLAWTASDPDGDVLEFDVAYAPDGRTWQIVAVGLREPFVRVDPAMLASGPAPAFRVSASDGFHASTAEASAVVPDAPRVLTAEPADGAVAGSTPAVTVRTLGPVALDHSGALTLAPADDPSALIAGRVEILPGGAGVRFVPSEALAAETTYRATFGAGVTAADGAPFPGTSTWTFQTGPAAAERFFPTRNLTGAALTSAAEQPDDDGPSEVLPESCGGIASEVWTKLIPGGAIDVTVSEPEGACRIELTSPSDVAGVRAFVERAILTNAFFLTANRAEGDTVRIGMQGRGLEGEAVIGAGPPTTLAWTLRPR